MQLTRSADYAVRVVIHLAALPEGSRATRSALAESAEVPPEFLGKVLQVLSRAGLILSYRGSQGGFELARPAASLTLLDVITAIEGPVHLNLCLATGDACKRSWWCGAHEVWKNAQAAMVRVLAEATIEDLAKQSFARLNAGRSLQIDVGGPAWN
jgi:Rrf2 family protein